MAGRLLSRFVAADYWPCKIRGTLANQFLSSHKQHAPTFYPEVGLSEICVLDVRLRSEVGITELAACLGVRHKRGGNVFPACIINRQSQSLPVRSSFPSVGGLAADVSDNRH